MPCGTNEQLAWARVYIPVSELNGDVSLQHKKEVVRILVPVPNKLPFQLHYPKVVAVELPDCSRLPVFGECRELLGKIDALHALTSTRRL
jgi:hypothetical protein